MVAPAQSLQAIKTKLAHVLHALEDLRYVCWKECECANCVIGRLTQAALSLGVSPLVRFPPHISFQPLNLQARVPALLRRRSPLAHYPPARGFGASPAQLVECLPRRRHSHLVPHANHGTFIYAVDDELIDSN